MSISIDLTGRTAFVTGSTRGIGRSIAETLHAAGAKVAVVGRTMESAAVTATAIGERAMGFASDVTDREALRRAIAECETTLGPIDILVNNAGMTRDNLLIRLSDRDWDDVLAANLTAAFVSTQAVIKGMMKRRFGRIINVTSISASPATRARPTTRPARPGSSASRNRWRRSMPPAVCS